MRLVIQVDVLVDTFDFRPVFLCIAAYNLVVNVYAVLRERFIVILDVQYIFYISD